MNKICKPEYSDQTKSSMAQMNERETSFELVEVRKSYCQH